VTNSPDDEHVLVDGAPVNQTHVPHDDEHMSPLLRRFLVTVGVGRLVIPLATFFTIVGPLVASISRGTTSNIYLLLLIRPSKDIQLWGGGLWRTTGDVNLPLLFLAWAPLMIVFNWAFFYLGRAYGPAIARGEGPRWIQRNVSPKNFALARTLLARKGPTIAILGRIAALPPTVLSFAAGTSDVSPWRYQLADTVGAVVSFAVTVGIGTLLGDAYESGGVWLLAGGVVLFFASVSWMTRWLQREAEVEAEAEPDAQVQPEPID
jgi:membrane protein DedA with SNARE-associated domain